MWRSLGRSDVGPESRSREGFTERWWLEDLSRSERVGSPMSDTIKERNLLFGVLALQMDFVSREALLSAMKTCATEQDKRVGDVLCSQGALAEEDDGLIDSLVRRFIERHDNDARRSLAAVTTIDAIRRELEEIGDPDLNATVDCVSKAADQTALLPDASLANHAGAAGVDGARFQLIKFHARGGLGEVWRAQDVELKREVAVKRLQNYHADNPQSRTRFLHEAEVTGRLEHRGIVPVYSLGHFADGRPFYAMRFVSGTSLKKAIAEFHNVESTEAAGGDRLLALRRLLGRFVDVCNTVAYAHDRGVLHRDLKPGNVILDDYGETFVVDWGLAKTGTIEVESPPDGTMPPPVATSTAPGTVAGTALGTPGFMSPEQAAGRLSELSPASDVYSLGATLYCLLTGIPPFSESNQSVMVAKVRAGDFPRPRQVISTIPPALEAVCLKAMAVAPEGRYATAQALGDEIERWLADQPVLAYPEPFAVRAARWVRRHKEWVAAAAALLMLSLLGLGIYDWRITAEQARTTDQLAMTRGALREILKVSGESLAFTSNTEKLRGYLAQLVLDRYQELGDKFPSDPGIRLETAQVFRVLGGIGRLTGQFAKSQEFYEKAIRELTALCGTYPGHEGYRRWLVEAFTDRGELNHMNGRTIDAESDFHAAIGAADKMPSAPNSANYRRGMGPALTNLSELLVLKNQHSEAYAAANRAVELLKPLAAPDAGSDTTTRDRWLLALALTDRGVTLRETGQRDRAARDFDEAARILGAVAQDDEEYDDCQFQLAAIANERGELLSTDPRALGEAVQSYEHAAQILKRLIDNHKVIPHYREEMARALCGRAAVDIAMNRIPDAERDCKAALDHLDWLTGEQTRKGAPVNPEYLSLLGQVLDHESRIYFLLGQATEGQSHHARAIEKLGRAIELDPARAADKVKLEEINARPAERKL
jgi:serine/threonine-protein kinase